MESIKTIYEILHNKFDSQNWWPVTDKGTKPTYKKRNNLTEKQKLEIVFGAILTQNTNWKNVEKAIINLNKNSLINIKKIIDIEQDQLAQIIRSSGYHNQKSKTLKNFCNLLSNNYNSNINLFFNNDITNLRKKLLEINGIGPETADSIILYAAKKPIFIIDAYTKRIFNRIGYKESTYQDLQSLFTDNLEKNTNIFNEYHALIVQFGKNICKTKPLCTMCPLNNICNFSINIKNQ